MRILGIETSFDDTCVAIYDSKIGLLANEIHNQIDLYCKYGGVVPELAAREHVLKISPLVRFVLQKTRLSLKDIDGIAYTAGPGLSGSLLVGSAFSCALGFAFNLPVIPINHMEGHLLSCMLKNKSPSFPFIGLLVSGKHTQLVHASGISQYKILGETLDDAVGEAFDKIAKFLNLGYPGGKQLSEFAKKGNLGKFNFPEPMKYHSNLNFSFSGLKTFTINLIKKNLHNAQSLCDIACEFEETAINMLLYKCEKALKITGLNKLVIGGGVSANIKLKKKIKIMLKKFSGKLFSVDSILSTDNAAMIAYVGMLYFKTRSTKKLDVCVYPKWSIMDINL